MLDGATIFPIPYDLKQAAIKKGFDLDRLASLCRAIDLQAIQDTKHLQHPLRKAWTRAKYRKKHLIELLDLLR
jgi:hypothetical protein